MEGVFIRGYLTFIQFNLFWRRFLKTFLKRKNRAATVKMPVKRGRKRARRLSRVEIPASAVAIAKFPAPPVVAVEAPRTSIVLPWKIAAVPPPAMMASVHLRNGLMSIAIDAMGMLPAMIAAGGAMMSGGFSNHAKL